MKKKLFSLLLMLCVCAGAWADDLYLVGGATLSGWNTGYYWRHGVKMRQVNTTTYEWVGQIKYTSEGNENFKICVGESDWNGYHPASANLSPIGTAQTMTTDNSSDYKWQVSETGIYKVTVVIDGDTKTISAEAYSGTKDGDYYVISTAEDFLRWGDIVRSGLNESKAKLTADIDLSSAGEFIPMASDAKKFKGELDGQGHKVSGISVESDSESNIGLFCYLADGANIHDIIVDGAFKGVAKIGGISAWARDGGEVTLTNVINLASVTATGSTDANAAGLISCATDNTKITATNCANMGTVKGQNGQCAAFAGWTQSGTTFTNCWNSGEISNMDSNYNLYRNTGCVTATNCFDAAGVSTYTQGTQVAKEKITTGEFCYTLNGDQTTINWYQKLGDNADTYPVPFSSHGQVYANGNLDCAGNAKGTVEYSNTQGEGSRDDHSYDDGWCSVCGAYKANAFTATDGWYSVATAKQLRWMAESVNEYNSTYGNANIKLTADIDYSSYTDQAAMIGKPSNTFKGVFDGQNHTITVAFNNTTADETALFRRINGGTVKNLKVAGTITTTQKYAGGIVSGIWQSGLIQNCEAAVTITDEQSGDATHGGILARVSDKTNNNDGIRIYNCLFSGDIEASNRTGCGGVIGWPENSSSEVKVKNCLVTGTINLKDDDNNDLIVRNTATVENTYYTSELKNNLRNSKSATAVADGAAASGELCFNLNGKVSGATNWYQTLPSETMPTPFSTSNKVYQNGEYQCDHVTPKAGTSATYSNTESATYDDHSFGDNGLCTVCKAVGKEPATGTDPESKETGYYQIANIGNLVWFSAHVNEGNTDANADVTADIAQGDAIYTPIGSTSNPYKGVFKGGFHTITLDLSGNGGYSNQGIFGVLTGGAKIYNLTSAGTIKGSTGVGGIAGSTSGSGEVLFCNVGNEAAVYASTANAGGILGVDLNSSAHIKMINVYSAGAISGTKENGGLSGWAGDNPEIINAYCISTVSNGEQFVRFNGDTGFNNTYGSNQITDDMLSSGELCYKLGDVNFRQQIGTDAHPVMSNTKPNVKALTINTACNDGTNAYSTFSTSNAFVVPSNITVSTVAVDNSGELTVTDYTSGTVIPAYTGVMISATKWDSGTKDFYFNTSSEEGTKISGNCLYPSGNDGITAEQMAAAASGTYYRLTMHNGETIGFWWGAENGASFALAANKAYLVVPSILAKSSIWFSDETSAINAIESTIDMNAPVYNIQGQRVAPTTKGILIQNGRKYFNK